MFSHQVLFSVVAVILTLVGYAPYLWDVLKKKTEPHVFTWFVFTIAGVIAYALQVFGGAGVGSWSLLVACVISFVIFLLSLRVGNKHIAFSDIFFLLLSLVALYLWLVVKQPILSAILATSVELLGFLPTVRKSWNSPYSETLFMYEVCVVRFGVSVFSLESLNILTLLYPAAWLITNVAFVAFLIARRKAVSGLKSI